jgi:CheY-like chemotaxis protein
MDVGAQPGQPAIDPIILVVDDNGDACELLGDLLRRAGYRVELAYDGPGALAVTARTVPDVAILDIGLPAMDGFELAIRLRRDPRLAVTRLIALTGYDGSDDQLKVREAGFHAHLVKPVSFDQLRATVVALLADPPTLGS